MAPRALLALAVLAACAETPATPTLDPGEPLQSTRVPGHVDRGDADGNGIPDDGVVVNGAYTSLYAYDAHGDYFWDLGDGRVQGTVGAVEDLDPATLTSCHYQIQYRGTFENDPFQDTGWIKNDIRCSGFDGTATYHYVIVHQADPRYTGNPDWSIWGTWEYHVLTVSGFGNLVRPRTHVGG